MKGQNEVLELNEDDESHMDEEQKEAFELDKEDESLNYSF